MASILLWARKNIPHINKPAVRLFLSATVLLVRLLLSRLTNFSNDSQMIPAIYRLVVMRNRTPDIAALDHQSLNTQADKATFYVFHVLPDWIVVAMLGIFNVKEICQVDFRGDERWWDETPKARAKRENKAREREMKKGAALELKSSLITSSSETDIPA
jgi:hypothetical protein